MTGLKILDCTLRDGGYKNNWQFKNNEIISIAGMLQKSGIDIIECGYLSELSGRPKDSSVFDTLNTPNSLFKASGISPKAEFVLMINYGEYNPDNIPKYNEDDFISGIRVAFHKKDKQHAIEFSEQIQKKGFNLYLQPMVISEYNKEELDNLTYEIQKLDCNTVYIVDSLGILEEEQILSIGNLFDKKLPQTTQLGLHLHGNAMPVFQKAKSFLNRMKTSRNLILDASVRGIGRGEGNLRTEDICSYLNKTYNKNYDTDKSLSSLCCAGCA